MELTILMPCLNEAETLGTCIGKALAFLQRTGVAGEVLVADNGSTDGSRSIAEEMEARVRFDLDYLRAWTPGLDLKILVKTFLLVAVDRKAY